MLRPEIYAQVLKAIRQYYDGTSIKFTATVNITVAEVNLLSSLYYVKSATFNLISVVFQLD